MATLEERIKFMQTPNKPILERVTVGHILTALLIVVSTAIAWGSLNTRVDALEINSRQNAEILSQLRVNNATLTGIAEALKERVNRIDDEHTQEKYNARPK